MSPIRSDASRLELFTGAAAFERTPAQAATAGPQAFSDFSSFTGATASVRLGLGGASVDPQHAARSVISFIAEA